MQVRLRWLLASWLGMTLLLSSGAASAQVMPVPADNELTADRVSLGWQLFFDKRLSGDRTVSCATCHEPLRGFTDNRRTAVGVRGLVGIRNAPTIIGACNQLRQFHDGRALLLEAQALGPIQAANEMGNTLQGAVNAIAAVPYYRAEFARVYGNGVTAANIAKSLAAFERTISSTDAPVDRRLAGDTWALNAQQERGFAIFNAVGCSECHNGPDFRDGLFHRTGTSIGESDQGRFTITKRNGDFKAFKTPTLREVGRTNPYFHNGRAARLIDVVAFYNAGGDPRDRQKDPRIRPLGLDNQQQLDLAEFLRTGFLGANYPLVRAPALP